MSSSSSKPPPSSKRKSPPPLVSWLKYVDEPTVTSDMIPLTVPTISVIPSRSSTLIAEPSVKVPTWLFMISKLYRPLFASSVNTFSITACACITVSVASYCVILSFASGIPFGIVTLILLCWEYPDSPTWIVSSIGYLTDESCPYKTLIKNCIDSTVPFFL